MTLSEAPPEAPEELPAKRGPVIPESIKPVAFDSVLAWYRPAVSLLAEKKGVVDTAVVAATPVGAAPEPSAAEPVPEMAEPVKKKSLLGRLFGSSKPATAPQKHAPAATTATPVSSKAAAKPKALPIPTTPAKVAAKPAGRPQKQAAAPMKLSLPAEPAAKPVAESSPPKPDRSRRKWFGRAKADKPPAAPSTAEPANPVATPEPKAAQPAKPSNKRAPKQTDAMSAISPASPPPPAPAVDEPALKLGGGRSGLFGRNRPASTTADAAPEKTLAAPALSIRPAAAGAETDIAAPSPLAPAFASPAGTPPTAAAPAKLALASRLPGAAAGEPPADESDPADEPELLLAEPEDDDPGELTRSILESRARAQEKPEDRPQNRAFPWLRR
jgi:hypothetical protein